MANRKHSFYCSALSRPFSSSHLENWVPLSIPLYFAQKSPPCRKEALLLRQCDPHHPAIERNLHTVKRFVIGRYTLIMGLLNMLDKKKRYKWGLILRSISLRNKVPITQVRSVSQGPFLLAAEFATTNDLARQEISQVKNKHKRSREMWLRLPINYRELNLFLAVFSSAFLHGIEADFYAQWKN